MKSLAIVLMILVSSVYGADEFGIHTVSHHTRMNDKLNNYNGGFYVKQNDVTVGMYQNSEGRLSSYLVKNYQVMERVTISTGIVTGYQMLPVLPLAVVTVTAIRGESLSTNVNATCDGTMCVGNISIGIKL